MEHGALTGQCVNAGAPDAFGHGVVVLLTDEKALHADHGAAHKRVLIEALHSENHVPTRPGDRKGNFIPQPHAKHGDQRG